MDNTIFHKKKIVCLYNIFHGRNLSPITLGKSHISDMLKKLETLKEPVEYFIFLDCDAVLDK
jgi:acetylornithine/succinyldiaminopimelate/putrescine aminotransferase